MNHTLMPTATATAAYDYAAVVKGKHVRRHDTSLGAFPDGSVMCTHLHKISSNKENITSDNTRNIKSSSYFDGLLNKHNQHLTMLVCLQYLSSLTIHMVEIVTVMTVEKLASGVPARRI